MTIAPKLTTKAACRVAGIDRDRFNEHVAAGRYTCAPATIPGRARLFDPHDMISLWLFRELNDGGLSAEIAGWIACNVGQVARQHPGEGAISRVDLINGVSSFQPSSAVPGPDRWGQVTMGGTVIGRVTTWNVAELRKIIAMRTDEERAIIGEDD